MEEFNPIDNFEKEQIESTCEMTVSDKNEDIFWKCGKPAKYITPENSKGKRLYVCGIHRGSVDKLMQRIGKENRCVPIPKKESPFTEHYFKTIYYQLKDLDAFDGTCIFNENTIQCTGNITFERCSKCTCNEERKK